VVPRDATIKWAALRAVTDRAPKTLVMPAPPVNQTAGLMDAWVPEGTSGDYPVAVRVSRNVANDRQVITSVHPALRWHARSSLLRRCLASPDRPVCRRPEARCGAQRAVRRQVAGAACTGPPVALRRAPHPLPVAADRPRAPCCPAPRCSRGSRSDGIDAPSGARRDEPGCDPGDVGRGGPRGRRCGALSLRRRRCWLREGLRAAKSTPG